jgi:hypothetical protein
MKTKIDLSLHAVKLRPVKWSLQLNCANYLQEVGILDVYMGQFVHFLGLGGG